MYKVELYMNNTYQVVEYIQGDFWIDDGFGGVYTPQLRTVKFQGSLSDCNAWIQLNDKGYL